MEIMKSIARILIALTLLVFMNIVAFNSVIAYIHSEIMWELMYRSSPPPPPPPSSGFTLPKERKFSA